MPRESRGDCPRRVFVELGDGHNFVGTVLEDDVDGRGRRTLLIEDSQGQQRAVRPAQPQVTISDADADADADGGLRGGRR